MSGIKQSEHNQPSNLPIIDLTRALNRIRFRVNRQMQSTYYRMLHAHFGYLHWENETMLTFHEIQLELNRQDAKLRRQEQAVAQTKKLIESLKQLQDNGDQSKKKG